MEKVKEETWFVLELNHRLGEIPGTLRVSDSSISSQTFSWLEAVKRSTKTVTFLPGEEKYDLIECTTCGKTIKVLSKHFDSKRTNLQALGYSLGIVFLPFSPVGLGVLYCAYFILQGQDNFLPYIFPGHPWLKFSAAVGAVLGLAYLCCLAWFHLSKLGTVECTTINDDNNAHTINCIRL
jgi:hypothetical protein